MDTSGIEPLYLNAVNPFTGNQYSKAYLELYKKRTELPVWRHKTEFMRALDVHQCILLEAETGSGKTTQVPQWCMEWWKKRHPHTQSMVCCTQPRRLATVSVAERVAKELDVRLGNVVGYSIRFEEVVDSGTLLKYCTDGVLLAESSRDEMLMRYGVILLDEVHERTMITDVVMGLVKEVESACELLEKEADKCKESGELKILPLFGSMQNEHLQMLEGTRQKDKENDYRRCIVATNVAETSMTIDGIVFVIDPGFCKRKIYNPRTKLESLAVQRISRASAVQRAGRAGRTRPGICFRLYTEHCYDKIMKEIVPEITHTNLGSVVLRLKKSGINDIYGFDLIDKPSPEQIQYALHMLTELGALDVEGFVTPLGEKINSLPVDPPLARMLIESAKLCCSEEVISICAMLSAPNRCFCRPRKKQIEADRAKAKFVDDVGDHLTLLRVYNAFDIIQTKDKREWCFENYLNYRTLQYAQDVRNQLANVMLQRLNLMPVGLKTCSPLYPHNILKALLAGSFMKLAYFCPNAVGLQRNAQRGYYVTVESHINLTRNKDDPVEQYFLHGSSVLFKGAKEYSSKPEWVLFNEAMQHNNNSNNQRCFLQTVSKIRPEWLAELAPAYRRQISLKSTALDERLSVHEKANKASADPNLRENELSSFTQLFRGISLRK